jgi:hypothetical protein
MYEVATIDMIDSIQAPATTGAPIPQAILKAQAIAGYIAGNSWPTWGPYVAARPDLLAAGRAVSITLTCRARARCLDIESGGATPPEAPGWYRDYADRTFGLPILYTYASQVQDVINAMSAAGIPRGDYLIWSAHPSGGRHICGPDAYGAGHGCGYPQSDGTQYATLQGNCDISIMAAHCFTPAPLPKPPPSSEEPSMITAVLRADGRIELFAEAQPSGDGQCGQVWHTWQVAPAGGWNGSAQGRVAQWVSLGVPGA